MFARSMFSLLLPPAVAFGLALPTPVSSQDAWQDPQPPCDIRPGHHQVATALAHLKEIPGAQFDSDRKGHLSQAHGSLVRAFQGYAQGDNPAAWYYLGRYYVYDDDGAGADSSFRMALELAPQCEQDIDRYRAEIQSRVMSRALEAWQAQATDSAVAQLAIARSLQPNDASVLYYLARMLAEGGYLDSAQAALAAADSVAGEKPAAARLRGSAILDVARGYETRAVRSGATQQLVARRTERDSLQRIVARDSTLLAELIAEWAGKPLRPDVQQAVTRDSTVLAGRLNAARQAQPALAKVVSRDSAAVWTNLGPALAAYERYLDAVPDDTRTLFTTLELAATAGADALMDRIIERVDEADPLDVDELSRAAFSGFNSGKYAAAARVLEIGLAQNPYHRTALLVLTRSYYALGDPERCKRAATRLVDVDPLNPQSLQTMALAWDLAGQRDSAQAYLNRSRSLGLTVNITQFITTASGGVLNASVSNAGTQPAEPTALVFEFLMPDGSVAADTTVHISAVPPRGSHSLTVRVERGGVVAWRYRRR